MNLSKLNDIKNYFLQHPLKVALMTWLKTNSLPGFFKVPIWDVLVFLNREIQRDNVVIRANAVAFSFFLSIFPALIAIFTLVPFFLDLMDGFALMAGFNETLTFEIKQAMPGNTGDELIAFIEDITTNPRFGTRSIGFILALFFASNGMSALLHGFEKASYKETFRHRSEMRERMVALSLTMILGFMLIISTFMIILGDMLIAWMSEWIKMDVFTTGALYISRWFIVVILLYSGITIIYRYGAATRKRFGILSPGATLATIASIISSVLFSMYLEEFDTYNKLYGSIGTIIALMLWIQINAMVLLIGFELNASIAVNRDLKKLAIK